MRRKAGRLLGIEEAVLDVGLGLKLEGSPSFHGFAVAKLIQETQDARRLTAHGTLYKALGRLERAGLLASEWEEPEIAAGEGRPRRRLYRVTELGETALAMSRAAKPLPDSILIRLATS